MKLHNEQEFIATCASGLEELVQREAREQGGQPLNTRTGAVSVTGTLETAYKLCLWSRYASRILMPLGQFPAPDPDTLYHGVKNINWLEHLDASQTFAVDCTSFASPINNSHFASLRVKDAVVDQFKEQGNTRPSVRVERPDLKLHLFLDKDQATLSIDLSGESLHRRGYRVATGAAPLKESLAAAIVSLSGFDSCRNITIIDPMCGSATLLIEAAMMFGNIAPGLDRKYFGFLKWKGHDPDTWNRLIGEAIEKEEQGQKSQWPRLIGYDADPGAVRAALQNIAQSDLEKRIHIEKKQLSQLEIPENISPGIIITNPPYGERLLEKDQSKYAYRCLGRKLKKEAQGWKAAIFTGNPDLCDAFSLQSSEQFRLYNGPIKCQLRIHTVPEEIKANSGTNKLPELKFLKNDQDAFANKLRKNLKPLLKWAGKNSIFSFRIYDAEIPEYNVIIDLYGHLVRVQENPPSKNIDPEKAKSRLKHVLTTVQEILGVKRSLLMVARAKRFQPDYSHGSPEKKLGRLHEVFENNSCFLANLTRPFETGLFLDQRNLRQLISNEVKGARFLNVFANTGTLAVCAANGKAKNITSVDYSKGNLAWQKNNLSLNGFAGQYLNQDSDCLRWLQNDKQEYDYIVLTPPVFSDSRTAARIFDIKRQHPLLIRRAMSRLAPGGQIIFFVNCRNFVLDSKLSQDFSFKNISSQIVPRDFERNKKSYYCWKVIR
jgi:23S rRNA (guanine2445-N2)-methyltransferase / 23S rRNA (guanine2069-N7)-methyltransferase